MKIKVLTFTQDDIDKGFINDEIYKVKEISISGDSTAYDIFYKITSNKGIDTYTMDLLIEEIEVDEEIQRYFEQFDELFDTGIIFERFEFNIMTERYLD